MGAAPDGKSYYVPYSSHSNYPEIERFIKSICPGVLNKVVPHENRGERMFRMNSFASYMHGLAKLPQRGHKILSENYVKPEKLSDEYRYYMKPENKTAIEKELKIRVTLEEKAALLEQWEEKRIARADILRETREKRQEARRVFLAERDKAAKAGLVHQRSVRTKSGQKYKEMMKNKAIRQSKKVDVMFRKVTRVTKKKEASKSKKYKTEGKPKAKLISDPADETEAANNPPSLNFLSESKFKLDDSLKLVSNAFENSTLEKPTFFSNDSADTDAEFEPNDQHMSLEDQDGALDKKYQNRDGSQVTKKVCKESDKLVST